MDGYMWLTAMEIGDVSSTQRLRKNGIMGKDTSVNGCLNPTEEKDK